MRISEIMKQPIHQLTLDKGLQDAAMLFRKNQVHGAHVVDEKGQMVGVFTNQDLIKALAKGAALSDPVGSHMREMICTVNADTELNEICWNEASYLAVSDGHSIVRRTGHFLDQTIFRPGS